MTKKQAADLTASLQRFDLVDPIVINKNNALIGGHQRINILKSQGIEEVDVRVPSRLLSDDEEKELNVRLNKNRGEWDLDALASFGEDFLKEVGFSQKEIEDAFQIARASGTLAQKYLVAPFSILDTRREEWLARRRAWLSLGIQSEIGRGGNLLNFSERAQLEKKSYGKTFGAEGNASDKTGTSIFDPVLCEVAYAWFCPPKARILDPFAGGSVRGLVAAWMGHSYTGIDLRAEQVQANEAQAAAILKHGEAPPPAWITGDSADIPALIPEGGFDFVFSCPPYFDLEQYSDAPNDLSNLDWEQFVAAYAKIIAHAVGKLKENRFACFVVSDVRDEGGFYRLLPEVTKKAFTDAGAHFYNDIVLVNSAGTLPIRVGRQFAKYRKVGRMHQSVLVFYKGDPKAIPGEMPEVEVAQGLEDQNNPQES